MFTPHMSLQILLPGEAHSTHRKSRIRTRSHPAKEPLRRVMNIVDMPFDILLSLEATTAVLTPAWMRV